MWERLLVKIIFRISIKWGLAYLTSQKEYLGSKWLERNVIRKG